MVSDATSHTAFEQGSAAGVGGFDSTPSFDADTASMSFPKPGGALQGLGHDFSADALSGAATFSVALPDRPVRQAAGHGLGLSYRSSGGPGLFGHGWIIGIDAIVRDTRKGVPNYDDDDVFLLGGQQLVPAEGPAPATVSISGQNWQRRAFLPRIEGAFSRVEYWWVADEPLSGHWRVTTGANVTTVYGQSGSCRIVNPGSQSDVFEWLAERRYDAFGNIVYYEYKAEDLTGISNDDVAETARLSGNAPIANRHLKRVHWGARTPYSADGALPECLFELVLDYGEHAGTIPSLAETQDWAVRSDPFSDRRGGFDKRTNRLCQQVILFHKFPELGAAPVATHSMNFVHEIRVGLSVMKEFSTMGYGLAEDGSDRIETTPPLSFLFDEDEWDDTLQDITVGPQNLPSGAAQPTARFARLDPGPLAGLLFPHSGGLGYARNLGGGNFAPVNQLPALPTHLSSTDQPIFLQNLEGTPQVHAVKYAAGGQSGYASLDDGAHDDANTGGWQAFEAFDAQPNVDFLAEHSRFIDLTGDGRPDLLLDNDDTFSWFRSLGTGGFDLGGRTFKGIDPKDGPRLVLNDKENALFVADMTGDGLSDLVRIRVSSIVYWPNLGHGRFGAQITMRDAPRFGALDHFDARLCRLVDLDGSGTADLVWLGDGIQIFRNHAGNGFAQEPIILRGLGTLDGLARIDILDLTGTGTVDFVRSDMRATGFDYIDPLAGRRPHVVNGYVNNQGMETRVSYTSSVEMQRLSEANGQPWATDLPIVVSCVSRIETIDHISGRSAVKIVQYAHGAYDYIEREFRGFARNDTLDTDVFAGDADQETYQAPVMTRSWSALGADGPGTSVFDLHAPYAHEYYADSDFDEVRPAPQLDTDGWSADIRRGALFASRGLPLRTETYGLDGATESGHPFAIVHQVHEIHNVQSGVFQALSRETLTHVLDRNPSDPRLSHNLVLARGDYGQPIRSASVLYPRRTLPADLPTEVMADQTRLEVSISEATYTLPVDTVSDFQLSRPCRQSRWSLTTPPLLGNQLFSVDDLNQRVDDAREIELNEARTIGTLRLIRRSEVDYLADNLSGPLPNGTLGRLGISYCAYALAWSDLLVNELLSSDQASDVDFEALNFVRRGRLDQWWQPSGTVVFDNDAATHFYLPSGGLDAAGRMSRREYDQHDLLIKASINPLLQRTEAELDYRFLSPRQVTDINGNRMATRLDPLGRVEAMATMGRVGDAGDTLEEPSLRITYDTGRWMASGLPAMSIQEHRENIGDAASDFRIQRSFYSGAGGVWQTKTRDEPGPALSWDDVAQDFTTVDTGMAARWMTTGSSQVSNKGLTVRAWEPFYSASDEYLPSEMLMRVGTSATRFYDALGRETRLVTADGTITRSEFSPWLHRRFDANDTVRDSEWYNTRGAPNPASQMPASGPSRAAWLAAQHHDTYATIHVGLTGTPVLAMANLATGNVTTGRLAQPLPSFNEFAFDAQDREAFWARKNYLGATVTSRSAERPDGTVIQSATGETALSWSGPNRRFRGLFDTMGRAIGLYEKIDAQPERLIQFTVYGDDHPQADALRLNNHVFAVFDDSGASFTDGYDMFGAPTHMRRRVLRNYEDEPDWWFLLGLATADLAESQADAVLDAESYESHVEIDAMGQLNRAHLPGGDVIDYEQAATGRTTDVSVTINGRASMPILIGSDANELGQITRLNFGNGVDLENTFDPETYRLTGRRCLRVSDGRIFQDAHFEYDPLGNIVEHSDNATHSDFFANAVTSAKKLFEYDALNRLVRASGRESAALAAGPHSHNSPVRAMIPHQNDVNAVRGYVQTYDYDLLNNITRMRHSASGGNWTRHYRYAADVDAADRTNRLIAVSSPGEAEDGPFSQQFGYNDHGVMTAMPHLANISWTAHDRMREVDLGGGGRMICRYGADGSLTRKIVERPGALRTERLYLGSTEIMRRYRNDVLFEERRTIFISVDGVRVAQIDLQVLDADTPANQDALTTQYSVDTVSGAASVTFDGAGNCIGFEEFHPFGTTAYWSGRSDAETSLRRYRWLARERDSDTGLVRIGLRHYAPWLGRWTSADPQGVGDGLNLYAFASCNPISRRDINGMQSTGEEETPSDGDTTTVSHPLPVGLRPDLRDPSAESGQRLRNWLDGQIVQRGDTLFRIDVTGMKYENGRWSASSTRSAVGVVETDPETGETITRSITPPAADTTDVPAEGGGGEETTTVNSTPDDHATDDSSTTGLSGGAITSIPPGFENSLWQFDPTLRGTFIDFLGGNNLGLMAADADRVVGGNAVQIRSTSATDLSDLRTKVLKASEAARDFSNSRTTNPGTLVPQAEIVMPRDTPDELVRALESTFDSPASHGGVNSGVRARPTTSAGVDTANPQISRGMPSRMRFFGPGMSVLGGGLSTYALYDDYQRGDVAMGTGDALGVAGAGVELAAFARSSTTLLRGGGVLAGASVAVTSGVRSYRAFQQGDTESGLVNALGVVGGGMLIAAAVVTGPWLVAGLLIGGLAITIGVAAYNFAHN